MKWFLDNWQLILFAMGLIETIIGALPNDKVPYRSVVLKVFAYLDGYATKHAAKK